MATVCLRGGAASRSKLGARVSPAPALTSARAPARPPAGAAWRPIRVGETWGGDEMSALFRAQARVPARFAGQKVVLRIYFSVDYLLSVNVEP